MKAQVDKKIQEVRFKEGDWVYVKLKSYRKMPVTSRIHHKVVANSFSPFQIEEKIGPIAYKLKLFPTSKVHQNFHVSLLKNLVQIPVEPSLPSNLKVGHEHAPTTVLARDEQRVRLGSKTRKPIFLHFIDRKSD